MFTYSAAVLARVLASMSNLRESWALFDTTSAAVTN